MLHVFRTVLFAFILSFPFSLSAKENNPVFEFGVIADIQYADDDPHETKHYRASVQKLADAVNNFNQHDLDFVIHLGDFIDNNFKSFDKLLPIWNKIKAKKYHVLGNHDYDVEPQYKEEVPKKLGIKGHGYYDFAIQGWRFIVLDGNELSFHAHSKNSKEMEKSVSFFNEIKAQGRTNAKPFNGGISMDQLKWLQAKLTHACSNQESVVLFSHYPIYPKHMTNLWNNVEVQRVLESHSCVLSHINGHNHLGNYAVKNGIHYLTLQGAVETPDKNAFAIVEVYQDHIKIVGQGREPSRTLARNAKNMIAPLTVVLPSTPAVPVGFVEDNAKRPMTLEESRSYKNYLKRPKTELSKLLFLLDRFKEMGVSIIYDGVEYDADFSVKVARRYLVRKYRKENATEWLKLHTYRSQHAGDIIMMKFPSDKSVVMRDAFLKELDKLKKLEASPH